jgi:ParB family chromosome partitioning protein
MGKDNRSFYSGLATAVAENKEVAKPKVDDQAKPRSATARKRQSGYLDQRATDLGKLVSGDIVDKTMRWVDPKLVRLWEHHNRRYELLDEHRCADLIEGLKAQGRQEFPAIVRRLMDDPDYDYEVVCGARRHWAISWLREHNYPEFKFLIEVRDLTDEEAFRLSDIENRDREDICDYERAVDYKKALKLYYGNHQSEMAGRLEVGVPWLSRYLNLAELPEEIVAAYPDVTEIRESHARQLRPFLKDRKTQGKIIKCAKEIAEVQRRARVDGDKMMDGKEVVRKLKVSVRKQPLKANVLATYECATTKKPMMEVARHGRGGLMLNVAANSGASKEELLRTFEDVITEYLG